MKYKTFNEEMEVELAGFGTGKLEIILEEKKQQLWILES